jgi:hypothetical protein
MHGHIETMTGQVQRHGAAHTAGSAGDQDNRARSHAFYNDADA